MSRIRSAHHVLGVKHLLGQLWYCEGTVLLGATRCEGCKAYHEEVQPREWNEIHCQFTKISVQLTWEAKARCDATHCCTDEVAQVTIGWCGQLKGPETDIVQGLIVKQHTFICILHQLMERQYGIVGLNDGIRDLGRWDHRECLHNSVWVLLANL